MATQKKQTKKREASPYLIRTLSITQEDARILDRMSQDASDYLGWTISGSAIMRALLRHAEGQNKQWEKEALYPFIERDIEAGKVWGKKKHPR